MNTRRDFLATFATASGALVAASSQRLVAQDAAPAAAASAASGVALPQSDKTAKGRYRPPFRIGLGSAPIGGSSGLGITHAQSFAIMENAWNAGIRYYDTSPFYGYGLAEHRFNHFLSEKPREEFVLSTKVGRVFEAAANAPKSALGGWANPLPFKYKYDYTAEGTRRSVEDSLQRLGLASIDIVFIHDLAPDNGDLKETYPAYFEQAVKGAMPELIKMKEEGIIKAWGLGVNHIDPILGAFKESDPDVILMACNYTLIDHTAAIEKVFPLCEERGASLVIGSPLNNGFLTGRDRFNYGGKPTAEQIGKRTKLEAVAKKHAVDLRTAALQFTAAPAVVSATIPGARSVPQPQENVTSMGVKIPADFWAELKSEKLLDASAPVPA
ncbi:aldo/keto reductase [Luteolibacter flavescens]|uniref:Aldo/keto reductase n=1 Tax=Luteolibacter flavescens TaxID=1859460 RepID=A0ABT3FVL6_9BACT|nr:aldo/keto reductase [Luteolibacter flavescens]MCW1887610.1 aldo/keto reductase [Luteolibacter flavescens]